jgi:endonuclease/exonuclease/phosphatase family metal-dependent hydrolase
MVTFNVAQGKDIAGIAGAFERSAELRGVDVLLLQEVRGYPAEGTSRAHQLAHRLGMNYVFAPSRAVDEGGTHGLAIFSRCPILDVVVVPLKSFKLPFKSKPRTALGATIDRPEGPLRVYNLHLDTTINAGERIEQLAGVVTAARADAVRRVVVGGDFNMNNFFWLGHAIPVFVCSQPTRIDRYMRAHGFAAPVARSGPTARVPVVRLRLDSFYTHGVEVDGFAVERAVAVSDHAPLWMDVVC